MSRSIPAQGAHAPAGPLWLYWLSMRRVAATSPAAATRTARAMLRDRLPVMQMAAPHSAAMTQLSGRPDAAQTCQPNTRQTETQQRQCRGLGRIDDRADLGLDCGYIFAGTVYRDVEAVRGRRVARSRIADAVLQE